MKKILIVNNEKETRNLYKDILYNDDNLFISAVSAKKALELLDTTFDLVIVDLDSCDSEHDAIWLARQTNRQLVRKIPIIIISKYLENIKVDDIKNLGIREFMHKPFDREELISIVKRVLNYNT